MTLLRACVGLDLGDKMVIATRFGYLIQNFRNLYPPSSVRTPDTSSLIWDNLGPILLWMSRCVKNGIQITLGILRTSAFAWSEAHHYAAACRLLGVLLFNFPDFMTADYNHIQDIVVSALDCADAEAKETAISLLREIVASLRQFNCEQMCRKITARLTPDSTNVQGFDGLIGGLMVLYNYDESYSKFFTAQFAILPLLKAKGSDGRLVALRMLPFLVQLGKHTSPLTDILRQYKTFLKKKILLSDALLSLAKVIFAHKSPFSNPEQEYLGKSLKAVLKVLDTPNAGYAAVALLSTRDGKATEKDYAEIFRKAFTRATMDGFCQSIGAMPARASQLYLMIIGEFEKILKAPAPSNDRLLLVFDSLLRLRGIEATLPPGQVQQYTRFLAAQSGAVRQAASRFFLY
jgi:hypothetical protein